MRHSNHRIHAPTLKSEQSRLLVRDELKRRAAAVPASDSTRRLRHGPLPPTLSIGMTGVREDGSFDAYIHVSLQGAAAGSACPLLLDSGNSVLVYPRFEDIQALPNYAADYKVLGTGAEPWGCPANVVQGPIVLTTTDGLAVTIGGVVFYACTADLPGWTADSGLAHRTANFGAACLNPWTSSAWNRPAGVTSVLQTPLSYLVSHPYAVVQYGAGAVVDTPAGTPHISLDSMLTLYKKRPAGFRCFKIVPNLEWMALLAKSLSIGGAHTQWPGSKPAIAFIDTAGGCAFLSDPDSLLCNSVWPEQTGNPWWTAGSTSCQTISASIAMEVGDATGSFTIAINEAALPAAAKGKTIVMCQLNKFMRGQYGLNIGGISALTNAILIDHGHKQVGFRSVGAVI